MNVLYFFYTSLIVLVFGVWFNLNYDDSYFYYWPVILCSPFVVMFMVFLVLKSVGFLYKSIFEKYYE